MKSPKLHKTVLPNGLRILVVPMPGNPTVTVQVLVEAGSHFETKKNNGVSHFLEHMCFKGTPRRPSALSITHELDAIGAGNNAFTAEEYTGYWAKARTKHFEQILDVVSDIYLHPLLPEVELEKERGVIIQEINMYEDRPEHVVSELMDRVMYGDQPAGWSIAGPKKNIQDMKRDDLLAYHRAHYIASKTAVIIAGGIDGQKAITLAKKYFKDVPEGKRITKKPTKESQKTPQVQHIFKKIPQTHILLGFRAYDLYDKRNAQLKLLATVLGKGMSSRLFQKLREEMGVCYYVGSGTSLRMDTGTFYIRAGVDAKRVEEVISVIMDEIRKLRDEKVSPEELAKAKEILVGRVEMGLETSDSFADWYGSSEIVRDTLDTPAEMIAKIRAVTPEGMQREAKSVFKDKNLNLAIVGPNKPTDTARIKKLLSV